MSHPSEPAAPRYTTEQLLDAIARALEARDMQAVAVLLRQLAVQAPREAQTILDALDLARRVPA